LEAQLKDVILKMLDTFWGYIGEDLWHVWDDITHPSMVPNLGPIYKAWSMMMKS
jgi:hypothetical protein